MQQWHLYQRFLSTICAPHATIRPTWGSCPKELLLKKTFFEYFNRTIFIDNIIWGAVEKKWNKNPGRSSLFFYWKRFEKYSETDSCTWKLICYRGSCHHSGKSQSFNWNSLNSIFDCESMSMIIPEACTTTTTTTTIINIFGFFLDQL